MGLHGMREAWDGKGMKGRMEYLGRWRNILFNTAHCFLAWEWEKRRAAVYRPMDAMDGGFMALGWLDRRYYLFHRNLSLLL